MKFLFCPKCRRRIIPPSFIMKANIKSEGGITLKCGVQKCTGKVKFKLESNDNTVRDTATTSGEDTGNS
jgi:hypothetical protein